MHRYVKVLNWTPDLAVANHTSRDIRFDQTYQSDRWTSGTAASSFHLKGWFILKHNHPTNLGPLKLQNLS